MSRAAATLFAGVCCALLAYLALGGFAVGLRARSDVVDPGGIPIPPPWLALALWPDRKVAWLGRFHAWEAGLVCAGGDEVFAIYCQYLDRP